VVGSLEVAGRGNADPDPEPDVAPLEEGGSMDGAGLTDGRVSVRATTSAGVDAARDLREEAVVRFEGDAIGAIDILPGTAVGAFDARVPGREGRRFVCTAPSAPNVLEVPDGRVRVEAG
jgi:hypothetical protein